VGTDTLLAAIATAALHRFAESNQTANSHSRVASLTNGEAIITTDVGQHQMWVAQFYPFSKDQDN
jgi:thiamine pyrophosphate-dependent acetolactate synthase large subunit-like protein